MDLRVVCSAPLLLGCCARDCDGCCAVACDTGCRAPGAGIMPSLEDSGWLARCKPVLHLSLHPMYTSATNLERAVNATRNVFPYVWETDMRTPFDFVKHRRSGYRGIEHGGISLIGTWQQLT